MFSYVFSQYSLVFFFFSHQVDRKSSPWLETKGSIYVFNLVGISFFFIHITGQWMCDIYEVHTISFQTFFVWTLLLIVHTWNSSLRRSNLLRLQCTCCTVPTNSGRPHGSPLVWACQWPSSQPLSSTQFSHNENLWA